MKEVPVRPARKNGQRQNLITVYTGYHTGDSSDGVNGVWVGVVQENQSDGAVGASPGNLEGYTSRNSCEGRVGQVDLCVNGSGGSSGQNDA